MRIALKPARSEASAIDAVQLVPFALPAVEGVGAAAVALAHGFEHGSGPRTRFVVGTPADAAAEDVEGFPVIALRRRTPAELAGRLGDVDRVLLHYANYGYQARGCPIWIVEGLARWKATGADRRLVTVFHELYATGPPWRSSFWLLPQQRRLAAALAALSDGLATSLDLYARILGRWAPGKRVEVLPMFSTVGEPATVAPLALRRRRLVVFGSPGVRARAYTGALRALIDTCERLEIEEVVDIGPQPETPPPRTVAGVPIQALGPRPASEIGELLRESLAGFLAYSPAFLGKSTIFAAYCAHAMLPVCAWPQAAADGAPRHDHHYWRPAPGRTSRGPADPQSIASSAQSWYLEHALGRHVETYRELLA